MTFKSGLKNILFDDKKTKIIDWITRSLARGAPTSTQDVKLIVKISKIDSPPIYYFNKLSS
jgi:hypothetical protein